jgi:hypothetical protein
VVGCYKHCKKPSGSVKGGEFLDQVSDCQFLGKDSLLHGLSKLAEQTNPLTCLSTSSVPFLSCWPVCAFTVSDCLACNLY